jgi:hypothetical protein
LLVVGVALWLGVVLVGSGLTWLVIDQVGRHVVTGQEPGEDAPVAGTSVTTSVPSSTASATPRRSATPGPSSRPSRVPSSGAAVTAVPGATPHTATRTPVPAPATTRPPRTQAPAPPQPQTVTRTWSGTGGRVTVSCTGADARLVSASPADGWRVEVGSRGPREVEVELKESAEEGAETHVKSRCSGGEPRFSVEKDD